MANQEYRRRSRCKFDLRIHIVLSPKYRRKVFARAEVAAALDSCVRQLAHDKGWAVSALESDIDHVHILLSYNPVEAAAFVVERIKHVTTFHLWQLFPDYLSMFYWRKRVLWSDGYFVCSVGDASAETIQQYIDNQG